MTDQRAVIDQAIREHAQTHFGGDLVVDWTLIIATIDEDNLSGIGMIHSREPMPAYIAKGLILDALDDIRAGHFDIDDEED